MFATLDSSLKHKQQQRPPPQLQSPVAACRSPTAVGSRLVNGHLFRRPTPPHRFSYLFYVFLSLASLSDLFLSAKCSHSHGRRCGHRRSRLCPVGLSLPRRKLLIRRLFPTSGSSTQSPPHPRLTPSVDPPPSVFLDLSLLFAQPSHSRLSLASTKNHSNLAAVRSHRPPPPLA